MMQLDPAYVAELGQRIAFVSALTGGFAAAFFAALLAAPERGKVSNWASGMAGFAAVSLLCSAFVATFIATGAHPSAPDGYLSDVLATAPRLIAALGLLFGVYGLMGAIACAGWMRSAAVGWTTTLAAAAGAVLLTWAFAGF